VKHVTPGAEMAKLNLEDKSQRDGSPLSAMPHGVLRVNTIPIYLERMSYTLRVRASP
jgi:hypothetical protein